MKKHYLIFERYVIGHSYVNFVCAETPLAALQQYLLGGKERLRLGDGTSVIEDCGSKSISYAHPLAYIETEYKTRGEWQIRELPQAILNADFAEGFCGEDTGWIDTYDSDCRPVLRREFPRSRARAFLWYLNEAALVTFYRRRDPGRIEILRRFRHQWDGEQLAIEPWDGDYDDLLKQLLIKMPSSDVAA